MVEHAHFVHLHVHTEYSLLDGACRLKDLVKAARDYRMPALAITDHGNMFGVIDFYRKAMARGVKPIIGCEVYVAPKSRLEKSLKPGKEAFYHLVLLVKDERGYKNLVKLASIAYLEGFYYKPRVDKEVLAKYHEGIIALSGCLKGEIPTLILDNRIGEAKRVALEYRDIFGQENFFLELHDHGIEEQKGVNRELISMGRELGIPLVATNDCHYIRKEDAPAHDILLSIQTATTIDDPNRLRFSTEEFYLKSPQEMGDLFHQTPEALENTVRIAERCNLELEFGKTHLPHYEPPEGRDLDGYLKELCYQGLKRRYSGVTPELKKRLEHELKIIKDTGYTSYFLIVWDFVQFAKSKGIAVGPGRGSAPGSLVAYSLGITSLDPLKHDLLFERFLNPERVTMPDIDIDFADDRRDEVISYVVEKYGKENVAQIITFGTMKARAVIRDVGRSLKIPYSEVDRIAKLIPPEIGMTIEKALRTVPELKGIVQKGEKVKRLVDVAKSLEGIVRHASTHAAGVVISKESLTNYAPLFKGAKGEIATQYAMGPLEAIGLLKMDFLGLRNLTVMGHTLRILKEKENVEIDMDKISLDDEKTFDLLKRAHTVGVFQIESSGMRDLLKKLKPEEFSDIVALIALYRPGPMGSGMTDDFIRRKHGLIPIKYLHPQLEPILKDTYGVILYQEQVIRIAHELAGFSLSKADLLRQAMGKKISVLLDQQRKEFVEGAIKNEISKSIANKIFDLISHFAGYGFNKCVIGSTALVDAETGQSVTVEDLYRKGGQMIILSCDNDLKIVKRRVVSTMRNGYKPVFKVTTALGKEIVVTDNHPFLTIEGWKELRNITIGEKVAIPRILPVVGQNRWEEYKLIVLAGILAEGNTCHPSGFYYYNNNQAQIEDFIKNLKQFDNTKPTLTIRDDGRCEVYAGTGKDTKFTIGQVPWNKGLTKRRRLKERKNKRPEKSGARIWIENLGLQNKKAPEKFIPSEIFSLTLDNLALFLGRLWSGDGFLFSKSNTIPFYATSSKRLAYQVQDLLLRFGILSRIAFKSFKYRGSIKQGYAVYLRGRKSLLLFLDKISPYLIGKNKEIEALFNYYSSVSENRESKDIIPAGIKKLVQAVKENRSLIWGKIENGSGLSMREFYGEIKPYKHGFRRSTIEKLANYFGSKELLKYSISDIYWDSIISVEYVGEKETYDVEVEDTHNFIANGIIVHNSHSSAYASISYQTAYLKANYPLYYMTALLTSEMNNTDKLVRYIEVTKRMEIEILPPDINESERDFTVAGDKIRFGLAAVKNVGSGAIASMTEMRQKKGKFRSLYHFCEEVNTRLINRRAIESLIKCGAFDSLGARRSQLMAILDEALDRASIRQKERARGQTSFLEILEGTRETGYLPDMEEWPENKLLAFEKEALGFYISGHPLARFSRILEKYTTITTAKLGELANGSEVTLGGIITTLRLITTRNGKRMAFAGLEDLKGRVEVIVFPDVYNQEVSLVRKETMLIVEGRVDRSSEMAKVIASHILPMEEAEELLTKTVHINMTTTGLDGEMLNPLKKILLKHPGEAKVYLHLRTTHHGEAVINPGPRIKVKATLEFKKEIEELLGEGTIYYSA